ncbi:MAG: NAD(P)-dependent oxidoreductase [Selenomonadaceae bacterium]|nr:NAD(P)-dependent oxidoreductase [Selenomonadaceae bacterium]
MKNVIVTGANGFVGSALVEKLVEKGVRVIALNRSFSESIIPKSDLVTEIETSLDDVDELVKVIPDLAYDAFYHLAWSGVNGPLKVDPLTQIKNIEIAVKCVNLCRQLRMRKFLCAGTIAEHATESLANLEVTNGGMVYGVAKHCARLILETYCKSISQPFVWMQFANIYGPSNKTGNLVSYTIGELKKDREAMFGSANQPYDFIYVDDLIEAMFRLGEKENRSNCYYIGSGKPRKLKEYIFEIGKLCGKEDLVKIGVRCDDGIKYTEEMFDISAIKNDIGEYISKDFSEGIKYTLENY